MVPPLMDVRCERCKTEYEFDDARITEAGVTVKCTTCGHVFKVKKKALVVTVPVKPGEADAAPAEASPPTTSVPALGPNAPAADKPREWKVRQSSGNVFTFKELTTLQKWIVERKVSRDDEISLTGETWKRLGNIAELASFFQVVDEALKAAQLQALQTQGLLAPMMTPPHGSVVPTLQQQQPMGGAPLMPSGNPGSGLPMVGAPTGATQRMYTPPAPQPTIAPSAPPPAAPPPSPAPSMQMSSPPPSAVGNEPRFVSRPPAPARSAARTNDYEEDAGDDLAAAGIKKSGGAGKWIVLLLLLAAAAGGAYYAHLNGMITIPGLPPPNVANNGAAGASGSTGASGAIAASGPTAPTGTPIVTPPAPNVVAANTDAGAAAGTNEAAAEHDAGTGSAVVAANTPTVDAGSPVIDAGVAAAIGKDGGDTKLAAGSNEVGAKTPKEPREPREPKGDFDSLMAQADRLREREKLGPALDTYGKAADLSPDRAEPYAGKGLVLLDMGQKPQAEAAFRQALKLNPRYAVAVMGLAETYRAMGRNEDAIQYYQKYLDILPNGPEATVAKSAIQRLKE